MEPGDARAAEIRVIRGADALPDVASGPMSRRAGVSAQTAGSEHIFMGVSRLAPGARSDAHTHTNCESALHVVAGSGRLLTGPRLDRELAIDAGDFIYVSPGAPHVVVNHGDADLVLVVARNTQVEQVSPYDPDRDAAGVEGGPPSACDMVLSRPPATVGVMNDTHLDPTATPQQRADTAEALAVERYLAMRAVWAPCWGAGRPRRPPAAC